MEGGGQDPSESGKLENGQVAGGCWSLFGKDGNQRGFSFSLNPSSAVVETSIALSLKINNVFRSYLDLVQSG